MLKTQSALSRSRFEQHLAARAVRMLLAALLVAGLAFTGLPAQVARAAGPFNVNTTTDTHDANPGNGACADSGGNCSLRAAIEEANVSGTPTTINVPAGTYTLSLGELQVGPNGNVTVTITGAGAASTIIQQGAAGCSGTKAARVFFLDYNYMGNAVVNISGLTISNGAAQGFGGGAIVGGGLGDSLTLSNVIISNNCTNANNGAGISWGSEGTLTISNTTFSNNAAGAQWGGAILYYADGFGPNSLAITNSTFTGNTSTQAGNAGGAIYVLNGGANAPFVSINGSTFTNNQATAGAGVGGAIFMNGGTLNLGNTAANRFVGNTAGVSASGAIGITGGTVNGANNWWGCNTGPGGTGCDKVNSTGGTLTTNPWVILKTTASPSTINSGGSTTLTTSVLQNSSGGALTAAQVAALVGLPVSWVNAVSGSFSGSQTSIQANGTATSTFTHDGLGCGGTASGQAKMDNVQDADASATATLTVQCSDLTAVKSNNVGGTTVLPTGWNWTIHVANGGAGYAAFANLSTILTDSLPDSGLTYGAPAVSGASGLTGTVNCAIDGSSDLSCTASGPVQLASGGSFDVVFSATPGAAGPYANPRPAGSCAVDPGSQMPETNEANNTCSNSVTVNTPPAISSASSTTFTVGSAGSFTITTTPGYPLATTIGEAGVLPAGVNFTDNGNGTATLAGTPGAWTGGTYPITFTASNGILPNATQAFTLTVNQAPSFTNANNSTFTAGNAAMFTVTTNGFPTGASMVISRTGVLPAGVTFADNGNSTATLSGTPAAGTGGTYPITLTASNGVSPDANQSFTLTVNQVPAITSTNTATFTETLADAFTVTTSGFPTGASMVISETGALPAGVTFTNNNNGTATLAGTPALGTNGSYPITITASNGVLPNATQNFTLVVQGNLGFTNGDNTIFVVGTPGTFTVTTFGTPIPDLSRSGTLPSGVNFTDNGNGTATLDGTPGAGTAGVYNLVFTAHNGVAPDATQNFTLNVYQVPAITSGASTTFIAGSAGTYNVTTTGFPSGASMSIGEASALPAGLTFTNNGNGTATLAGTPAAGTGGVYNLLITASNGVPPNATQLFTLTINENPAITSANNTTFSLGAAGTFIVAANGYPTVALSRTGSLPAGVNFTDNGNGTATLAGTPAAGTAGDYPLTLTAGNGIGPDDTQSFTLHVIQAPAITSANNAAFAVGQPNTFAVMAQGFPIVTLSESGALPTGVTFVDNGNNTATLSGIPAVGTNGTYNLVLTAQNTSGPDATQNFTLFVGDLPVVTNVNSVADTGDGQILQNEHTNVAITQLLVVFSVDMNAIEAQTTSNYSLFRNGVIPVTINSITYSSLTQTATLNVNSGVALPNGNYALTVRSTLHDTGGLALPADFVRNFVVDTVGPVIATNGVGGQPGNIVIADNNSYTVHFTAIAVTFNKDVSNAGGGAGIDDVTNPLNYLLIQAGPNTLYDTVNCSGGLAPDDVQIPTGPVTYNNNGGVGPFVATVAINGGVPLPIGEYRLFVCGTTSIVDLAGNPLNGGADSILNFSVFDATALPATGFAPNRITPLPEQPADKAYAALGDLWLEVPRLGVQVAIVGVPVKNGTWDVSWLGSQAGWLNGTAFPTTAGNSVLTGHVYLANGRPGPFVGINGLAWGDKLVVHAFGGEYTYEVRSVRQVGPGSLASTFRHEELPWLTLVTCRGYDEASNSYRYRVVVRAVLIAVK